MSEQNNSSPVAMHPASRPAPIEAGVKLRGAEKMAKLGIKTGADLRERDIAFLRDNV